MRQPSQSEHFGNCVGGENGAHLKLVSARDSPMCWAPSSPIEWPSRLQGRNKEQPHVSAPADNKASVCLCGAGKRARTRER
eukprot:scaffold4613_cov129-Isochrysis_galbana.AAC.11